MKTTTIAKFAIIAMSFFCIQTKTGAQEFLKWAQNPPMGWNSYNCFGAAVTEDEVKGNAKMMEVYLKDAGWQYIVIDYCWFFPYVGALNNPPQTVDFKPSLIMDQYGRLLPALDRFPSAANGKGFKSLGDYIHGLGLKFGIHVMRGIPREAVAKKIPVKGTSYTADQVTDFTTCGWLNNMYGVDVDKPGGQEYYNSIFELYATWGVDYVKVDDIAYPYREKEIEGIRKAIDNCGRKMVLSLSPGDGTPSDKVQHLKKNANLWRISADFWDNWESLEHQFELAHTWEDAVGNGNWPDLDMIPFGTLNRRGPNDGIQRESKFTLPEKYTLMTLWGIMRSPLMYGGDLMLIRPTDLKLLRNKEVIDVNQNSKNNRQLSRDENFVVWLADTPEGTGKYLAVFNISENSSLKPQINLSDIGFNTQSTVRDLWEQKDIGPFSEIFSPQVEAHGAALFLIEKQ